MDFIDGLPKSEGYDVILVVVDCLTKYAHFLPLKHPFSRKREYPGLFITRCTQPLMEKLLTPFVRTLRALWDKCVKGQLEFNCSTARSGMRYNACKKLCITQMMMCARPARRRVYLLHQPCLNRRSGGVDHLAGLLVPTAPQRVPKQAADCSSPDATETWLSSV